MGRAGRGGLQYDECGPGMDLGVGPYERDRTTRADTGKLDQASHGKRDSGGEIFSLANLGRQIQCAEHMRESVSYLIENVLPYLNSGRSEDLHYEES